MENCQGEENNIFVICHELLAASFCECQGESDRDEEEEEEELRKRSRLETVKVKKSLCGKFGCVACSFLL